MGVSNESTVSIFRVEKQGKSANCCLLLSHSRRQSTKQTNSPQHLTGTTRKPVPCMHLLSSGMWLRVVWYIRTIMSEEPAASIFRRWVITSEVLITVNILSNIGWNMTPCSLVGKYQHFEGTYCFHVQRKRRWKTMEVAGSSETFIPSTKLYGDMPKRVQVTGPVRCKYAKLC
jgi:hypothetical protein